MEFYICSSCYGSDVVFDKLLREYPQFEKYNPLTKVYQYDWGSGHMSTHIGLFIELNSLEDLVDFSNKIGKGLVINDCSYMYDMEHNQINSIEIYDDWRE